MEEYSYLADLEMSRLCAKASYLLCHIDISGPQEQQPAAFDLTE